MYSEGRQAWKLFDTLSYSMGLKQKGVKDSEIYAILLADALAQNIYSKPEVDGMLNKSRKKHDLNIDKICREMQAERQKFSEESYQLRLEIERMGTRAMVTTIGILGSLIVLVGALATFSHAIFH